MTLPSDKKPLPERIDKTLNWLGTSRDNWRDKTKIAKDELKKKTLAVKRARETRDEYKELLEQQEKAYRASQDLLEQKNFEIIQLQKQLAEVQVQVEELKKSPCTFNG
jgi:chromosome segregation ATPase